MGKKMLYTVCFILAGVLIAYLIPKPGGNTNTTPSNASSMVPDSYGQPDDITTALNSGNAATLAKYLAEDVDWIVFDEEDLLTADEAAKKLETLFGHYPAEGFSIQHRGQSANGGHSYLIGNYRSGTQAYRTYITFKKNKIIEFRMGEK